MTSLLSHLECGRCRSRYDADRPQGLCACGAPLLARYHVERMRGRPWSDALKNRAHDLWRYQELLPPAVPQGALGEGYTPLLRAQPGTAIVEDYPGLYFKWEGDNPTGSFKARGMSVAVSRAAALGVRRFVVPTAGNAGVAAAAYVQAVGGEVDVFMPSDTDAAFFTAAADYGARVHKIDGLISDCGRAAQERLADGAFDLSTLKEPYRLEGKKTMGFELWEQFEGRLPDAIVYPTGGGTGLIGMWKAFAELQAAGLVDPPLPRMISVQMAGCAPMVRAFEEGREDAEPWEDAHTDVLGLRVPSAVGDFLILRALRESGGTAIAVAEDEAFAEVSRLRQVLRLDPAPEDGAALAALGPLCRRGDLRHNERVVVFLTGSADLYRNILARHGVSLGAGQS